MLDYREPEWVAEKLGLEKNTVYKFLQEGRIPAVQLGRKWLISESRLEQWLREEAERQTQQRREAEVSTARTIRRMDSFSVHARQVLRAAHTEARQHNHTYLGQEHLLLGFAGTPEAMGTRVLTALAVGADGLREEFAKRVQAGEGPSPRRLGRTPRTKQAMRLAGKEAERAGAKRIGSEHLLLGILLAGEGMGYDMLKDMGVTVEAVREQIALAAKGENHGA